MTDFVVSPSQDDVLTVLGSFLLGILPAGIEVILAQDNRVPEPIADDFVTLTPMFMVRLSTNYDTYDDVSFTGSISALVMTVTSMTLGSLAIGQTVSGIGVSSLTKIVSFGTGTGGIGTYNLNNSQVVASRKLASGGKYLMQPAQFTMQVDIHGPNSSENAQVVSTCFRDDYSVQIFKQSGFDIVPMYADDPKQMPFTNEQQQVENRWSISAVMQVNQVLRVPQQFADELDLGIIQVEATYPA